MSIFKDFFVKEKPVFTGITRGLGGFGFGKSAAAGGSTPFSGSGGTVSAGVVSSGYRYHYFKSPGNFDVDPSYNDASSSTIDIFVIGGGGSGGPRVGGGGGAGGIAWGQNVPIPVATAGTAIPITVGSGGPAGATSPSQPGNDGGDSAFGSTPNPYYAIGKGGGGGGGDTAQQGRAGGSSGGGQYESNSATATQPTQNPGKPWVTNYGNTGGTGVEQPHWHSGGGGGAGGIGGNASQTTNGRGTAGPGESFPTFSVPAYMPAPDPYRPGINPLPGTFYGGGGGSGSYPPFGATNMPSPATYGGGGVGGPLAGSGNGTAGVNGLGGGGGGGTGNSDGPAGGIGGNGIVVIRYSV